MKRLDPARRVDRNLEDFLRRVLGHLLDLDAAFGRAHQGHPAGFAVDQQPEIELASDVAAFLDIDALDLAAGRSGLVGDEIMAEQGPRRGDDILLGADDFDSSGLAAAAGMDLSLDHPNRPAEPPRHSDRLRGGIGDPAARHGDAKLREQLFRLVFVDIHRISLRTFIVLTTSISSRTPAADLSNSACSSGLSSISTIRSTPPAPITTGTPT